MSFSLKILKIIKTLKVLHVFVKLVLVVAIAEGTASYVLQEQLLVQFDFLQLYFIELSQQSFIISESADQGKEIVQLMNFQPKL